MTRGTFLHKKYFLLGFNFKVIGLIIFTLMSELYFKYGDTNLFFVGVKNIFQSFYSNYEVGLELIFRVSNNYSHEAIRAADDSFFFLNFQSANVPRLSGIISLFCFNSYLCTSLVIALYTYLGFWKIYMLCNEYFHGNHFMNFLIIFCIPSVVIWSSGILKDSFAMAGFGFCIYSLLKIFLLKKQILLNLVVFTVNAIVILLVKEYILFSLIGSFGVSLVIHRVLTKYALSVVFIVFVPIGIILFAFIFNSIQQYIVNEVMTTAIERQKIWNGGVGGSDYSLGELDSSLFGFLKIYPKALTITLYRPFLWENSSLIMLFDSILSLIALSWLLLLLAKFRVISILSIINSTFPLLFFLIFTLLFAFFAGVNTGNFGSLSRYRTPCLITYFLLLSNVWYVLGGLNEKIFKKYK